MAPLVQLFTHATIKDNFILLPNSFLGHDSTMNRFSHITANSFVGGNVILGYGSHIGTNATIKKNVNIDNLSIVDLGSIVLSDVPCNSIFVGNPARLLKKNDMEIPLVSICCQTYYHANYIKEALDGFLM